MPTRPPFDSLPLRKDGPRGNAWGLYGDDDELGTINMLTAENTANAAKEITDGTRIPTDWPLDSMTPPGFKRQPFDHHIHNKAPRVVNDDILTFNTQSSTQWDGLRHYGYQDEKLYYNGRTQEQVSNSTIIGTQGKSMHSVQTKKAWLFTAPLCSLGGKGWNCRARCSTGLCCLG